MPLSRDRCHPPASQQPGERVNSLRRQRPARFFSQMTSFICRRTWIKVRRIRGCVRNRLVEVTTRTFQGRHLLHPSPEVNRTIKGVIGRGQRRTGIDICGLAFMSNHAHMLLVPESTKQLSEFMGFVNGNIARKVGPLQGWRGKLWERRYQHIIISDELEAQIGRLKYLFSQGPKEGLVRHSWDWPGVHCVGEIRRGYPELTGGIWHDQTAEGKARRAGKVLTPEEFLIEETILLSHVPRLADWRRRPRLELIEQLLRECEQTGRELQRETGRPPTGPRRILMQVPDFQPKELDRSPAPSFHAVTGAAFRKLREEYKAFVNSYRECAEKLKEGALEVAFPPGCFPPHLPYVPEVRAGP